MTNLRDALLPLLDAEQSNAGPGLDAVEACWARIAADVERGVLPAFDVLPPARPRRPYVWLALGIVGAGILASSLYLLRPPADLPFVPESAAPSAPAAIPAAAPQVKTPVQALPAPISVSAPPQQPAAKENVKAAPAIRSRSGRAAAPTTTELDPDTFAAELRLLAEGQAALSRDDYAEALRISDVHRKLYPRGHFTEDRDALRVLALCESQAGQSDTTAADFLRAHPRSIHATRIRETCDRSLD